MPGGLEKARAGTARGMAGMTLLLAAAMAVPVEARAQDPQAEERECRCVDREGNEIENCGCFGTVEWSVGLPTGRARVGVLVSSTQPEEIDRVGVRLQEVVEGSPADEAGLRDGDIVVRIDGRSVLERLDRDVEADFEEDESRPVQRFLALVRELEPEEEVDIVYLRDGAEQTATLSPERDRSLFRAFGLPDEHVFDFRGGSDFEVFNHAGDAGNFRFLVGGGDACFSRGGAEAEGHLFYMGGADCVDGVRLQDLNDQLASYFEVEEGVLVTEVLDGATLGLQAGDVIVSIGDRDVEDADDVRRILRSYETDEPLTLGVVRRGEARQIRGTRR